MDGFLSFLLFAVLFYLMMRVGCGAHVGHGRHGERGSGGDADPAKHVDPVCGKRVNRNRAHIVLAYKGQDYLLCCPACQAQFEREPEKYLR